MNIESFTELDFETEVYVRLLPFTKFILIDKNHLTEEQLEKRTWHDLTQMTLREFFLYFNTFAYLKDITEDGKIHLNNEYNRNCGDLEDEGC